MECLFQNYIYGTLSPNAFVQKDNLFLGGVQKCTAFLVGTKEFSEGQGAKPVFLERKWNP
jgi:hypothetical protein